jgi:hypothetical protein
MKKKDGIAAPSKASLDESFRCGQCLHYRQSKHRSHEDLCSKLGIRAFAIAPSCFTPDYTKVIQNTDEFVQLAALMNDKTPEQRKIMLGILRQKPMGRKLRMGTKLYLNIRGREYISNYLCGFVVGYTSANEIVLCGSPDRNGRGRAYFAYMQSDESLLTPLEWKKKYLHLRKLGRIQDPKAVEKRDITAKVEADTYEVPTIDNAPKDPNAKKAVNKNAPSTSLVQILKF